MSPAIFPIISELTGEQERRPGDHNWPDLEIVIDPAQTEVVDDGIYLLQVLDRKPVVKRLRHHGEGELYLHPALATVHNSFKVSLFGKSVPCQSIEFSDNIYTRYITVIGRMVGFWAASQASKVAP